MGKFIFAMPLILIAVAIAVYFILIPQIYGETISVIDWLMADSKKIIGMLSKGNFGLPQMRGILALEIFWWIWLALFVASLFFVGKRLQNPEEKFVDNAALIKNEPYVAVQNVLDVLRQYPTTDKLEEVINSVKKLADRLAVESSFGRGDSNITDCEKNIATLLSTFAENFQVGDSAENAEKIMDVVKNLNSLLSLRTNLEKRR